MAAPSGQIYRSLQTNILNVPCLREHFVVVTDPLNGLFRFGQRLLKPFSPL